MSQLTHCCSGYTTDGSFAFLESSSNRELSDPQESEEKDISDSVGACNDLSAGLYSSLSSYLFWADYRLLVHLYIFLFCT